ncbi:MAG TPA: hypothetical protein VE242_03255, partial [Chthoniobacterales bacterium]|nr:hypothetical protein [Chthoniobacterales bacterium]
SNGKGAEGHSTAAPRPTLVLEKQTWTYFALSITDRREDRVLVLVLVLSYSRKQTWTYSVLSTTDRREDRVLVLIVGPKLFTIRGRSRSKAANNCFRPRLDE